MKYRFLFIAFGLVLLVLACASSLPVVQWATPLNAEVAQPLKVAVLVDASYLRRAADQRSYISIRDSITLGQLVNDETERGLTAAKMTITMQKKYFIAAYLQHEVNVAQEIGNEVFKKMPPVHLDPTVCRTDRMKRAVTEVWARFAAIAAEGEGALASELVPAWATQMLGSNFDADTIALVIAVVRKDDDVSPEVTAPNVRSILSSQSGSAIMVGLIRAVDGKIVYFSATSIQGPQRDTYTREAVAAVFAGLPKRTGHPPYPMPPIPRSD